MSRSPFQPGPATDHYHETVGVEETPKDQLGTNLSPLVWDGTSLFQPNGAYLELDNGPGGTAQLYGATGPGGGGAAVINGGNDTTSGTAWGAVLTAFPGNIDGSGGVAALAGGAAAVGSNANGGDITLTPGPGDGAGRSGLLIVTLPTADPHVVGALWNDTGTLKVSAG